MKFGNMPGDGGHLILSASEAHELREAYAQAAPFILRYMGSQEVTQGIERYCLWLPNNRHDEWANIPPIAKRLASVTSFRQQSSRQDTVEFADTPNQFIFEAGKQEHHAILVPSVTSERRPYLPVERVGADVIASNLNQVLYDAPEWCIALIASRLHLVWIATVCGKLETRYRYSNTIGWNTFPLPTLTEQNKADLTRCAENILLAREAHYPASIADLYDPETMPANLRAAHARNDEVLERIYIGRTFRNDTERLEKLFDLYTKMTAKAAATPARKTAARKQAST